MYFGNHHLWWLGCTVGLEGLSMNESAFPWSVDDGQKIVGNKGMTLRDYFAAQAMQGVYPLCQTHEIAAKECYKVADAMIKERTK